jgi:hypothetical protein
MRSTVDGPLCPDMSVSQLRCVGNDPRRLVREPISIATLHRYAVAPGDRARPGSVPMSRPSSSSPASAATCRRATPTRDQPSPHLAPPQPSGATRHLNRRSTSRHPADAARRATRGVAARRDTSRRDTTRHEGLRHDSAPVVVVSRHHNRHRRCQLATGPGAWSSLGLWRKARATDKGALPERVPFRGFPYLFPQAVYNRPARLGGFGKRWASRLGGSIHAQVRLSTSERDGVVPTLSTLIHRSSQGLIPSSGKPGGRVRTDVDKAWGNRCGQALSVTRLSTSCGSVWISC